MNGDPTNTTLTLIVEILNEAIDPSRMTPQEAVGFLEHIHYVVASLLISMHQRVSTSALSPASLR
jgi:hypothetical protein